MVNLGVIVDGLKERSGQHHQLLQLTDCDGESNIAKVMILCYLFHDLPSFSLCMHIFERFEII